MQRKPETRSAARGSEAGRVVDSTLTLIGTAFCVAAHVAEPAPGRADARKEHAMTMTVTHPNERSNGGSLRTGRLARALGLALLAAVATLALAGAANAYSVTVQIRGAGVVTGPGINCTSSTMTPQLSLGQSGDCFEDYGLVYPGTTLAAAIHAGSNAIGWGLAGWNGCSAVAGANCGFGGIFDPTAYVVRANFSDTMAPPITLVSGPAAGSTIASTSASFTVSTTDGTASFRCSVDSNPPTASCGSSSVFIGLGQGSHTFRARAVDPSGNLGPIVERTWIVDTVPPPVPSIGSGPSGNVSNPAATFGFSVGEPGATLECRLDGAAYAACTSPRSYPGLAEGGHSFQVRARDLAGNVSAAATRSWIVDTIAPSAPSVFQVGPSGPTSFTVGWSAATDAQGVTGYAVFLNGAPAGVVSAATLQHAFSGLSCGLAYSAGIEALDAAGNRSARTSASVATAPCPPQPKCLVPQLKGKTLAQAKALLEQRNCKLGTVKRVFHATVKKGRIIKQNPAAGTSRPAGTKVNVVVSRGKP